MGLASREYFFLPDFVQRYAGDILWALMVFLGFGFLFPRLSTLRIGIYALIFAFSIEFSQLYHARWIDAIRYSRLGGLVLGFGFLWSDLLCYTLGVSVGVLIETIGITRAPIVLLRKALTNHWFLAILCFGMFVAMFRPGYEYRGRVPSPDGSQALMVYASILPSLSIAPGDGYYRAAYTCLVDDSGKPVGYWFFRNCDFQIGAIYRNGEYRAHWTERTVAIDKFVSIDRQTGRADCRF